MQSAPGVENFQNVQQTQTPFYTQSVQFVLPYEMVLLPSKTSLPVPPKQLLKRDRISEAFGQTLFCPLTTVIASAGFGKTTAILSWVEEAPKIPIAWLHLDEGDNSLDHFWRYFIAAIRHADKNLCHDFSKMQLGTTFDMIQPIIDSLICQLSEYKKDFVFVLEDFHAVHEAQDISESLHYFIKHLPPHIHIIISSRTALEFPTQKLRVEGRLNEITEADLRFTRSDIMGFFAMKGIALSQEDLVELCTATRGWPTGIKLIMLLYNEDSPLLIQDALSEATPRISSYLLEEVFNNLTVTQQEFLVATSTVSAFCPSLAERLTGLSNTEVVKIIDYFVNSNLFIERTDESGSKEWFRYQKLFAEMLRGRLERIDSEEILALRMAARDWFEEHGYLDYVVELSANIKDYAKIKEVILKNWLSQYMADAHITLLQWADLLPEDEILKSPILCAVLAMPMTVVGNIEKGNAYILRAVENLHDNDDFLFALCMAQKAYISIFQDDVVNARTYAQNALDYLPEAEYYLRGMMLQIIASSYFESDPLYTKAGFLQAIELQRLLGNKNLLCSAYSNISQICIHLGHIEEAEHYANLAINLYKEEERQFKPMLAYAYASLMGCHYQRADYQNALEAYNLYEPCAINAGITSAYAEAKAMRAKILYALDDEGGKGEFFQALAMSDTGALLSFPTLAMSKDYAETFRTKALEQVQKHSPDSAHRVFEYSLAMHLGFDISYEEVGEFADSVDREERNTYMYAKILAALYCEKAAQHTASLQHLACALSFAEAQGLQAPLRENTKYLRSLFTSFCSSDVWANSPEAHFIQHLLSQQKETPYKLTEREVDVIRIVANGLTVADAANHLYVSKDTIKKHLGNIYTKLGVHSKMQAVALLQQKGII